MTDSVPPPSTGGASPRSHPPVQAGGWAPPPRPPESHPERIAKPPAARRPATLWFGALGVFLLGGVVAALFTTIVAVAVVAFATGFRSSEELRAEKVANDFIAALERQDFEQAHRYVHRQWSGYRSPEDLEADFSGVFRYLGPRHGLQKQASGTSYDSDGDKLFVFVFRGTYEADWPEFVCRLYENPVGEWRIFSLSIRSDYWDVQEAPEEQEDFILHLVHR